MYIQHVGSINMKKMYELTTEERMLKFHVQARGIDLPGCVPRTHMLRTSRRNGGLRDSSRSPLCLKCALWLSATNGERMLRIDGAMPCKS